MAFYRPFLVVLLAAAPACTLNPNPGADDSSSGDSGDETAGHSEGGGHSDDGDDDAPAIPTSGGDETAGHGSTSTASDPGSTTVPPDPTDTSPPDPTGPDNGCEDGASLEFKPDGQLEPLSDDLPGTVDAQNGEFGGVLGVTASRPAEDPAWFLSAWATFFTISHPGPSVICGVELDPLDGPDDCGVRYFGGFGWGSGDYDAHSAGAATLVGPGFSEAMVMAEPPNESYFVSLDELGHTPAWNEAYGLDWTGDELPAGELPALVTLPQELLISAPTGGDWVFAAAELEFAWTGTGDAPLVLRAIVTPDPQGGSEWFELTCTMVDDGAFVVPADMLALLPPGWSGSASLVRLRNATAEAAGRTILGGATVAVDARVQVAG